MEQRYELMQYGVVYVDDTRAVEFWASVDDLESGDALIVTGRYCPLFGEPELVWFDGQSLHSSEPLHTVCARERELMQACEREHQHARFDALCALMEP